jgi:hypothetical protein
MRNFGARAMSLALCLYGATVLICGAIAIVMTTQPDAMREKAAVEALKSGDADQAVRLMLDL